jgi:phage tail-like protein
MRRSDAELLLPEVVRRTSVEGSPLAGMLDAAERLHAASEAALAALDGIVDPQRAPDRFVPYLARFVDLDRFLDEAEALAGADALPSGQGRLRQLVARAAALARVGGTRAGLVEFCEVATGVPGFTVDDRVPGPDGRPLPYHVRVVVPSDAAPYRRLVEAIVAAEKPAFVTAEVVLADPPDRSRPVHPQQ